MRAIVDAFATQHDHDVTLSFGSSGKFYAQINNGAPFDVFLSADQTRVDALEADQLTVTGSRFTYAIGRLALWTSTSGVSATGDARLRRNDFDRLAVANPRLAPYGRAAAEVLSALGVQTSKWVMGENVGQAYAFVHSGNADLGLIALSQVIEPTSTKTSEVSGSILWQVEPSLHSPIAQDAVLLKRGADNAAAQDLLAFLRSDEARAIIKSYGYDAEQGTAAGSITTSDES